MEKQKRRRHETQVVSSKSLIYSASNMLSATVSKKKTMLSANVAKGIVELCSLLQSILVDQASRRGP